MAPFTSNQSEFHFEGTMNSRPVNANSCVARASYSREGNLTPLMMTAKNINADPVYANCEGMRVMLRLNPEIQFTITILPRVSQSEASPR